MVGRGDERSTGTDARQGQESSSPQDKAKVYISPAQPATAPYPVNRLVIHRASRRDRVPRD